MLRLAGIFFLALFVLIFVPGHSRAIKPRPPIEISFSYSQISETETRIVLIALANVEAKKVDIRLERPPGLRLIEGDEHWEGPMKRGERKKIQMIVQQGSSDSYEILGKASIHPTQGGIFRQKRRLALNRSDQNTLDRSGKNTLSPRPPIRHKGSRDNILEFR